MPPRNRIKNGYWIKRLVRRGGLLADQEIADILLTRDGFKPAAIVEVSYPLHATFSRKEFHIKISDLRKILQKLGLSYRLHTNYPKNAREVTRYSYVAKDRKKFKKIIAAEAEKNIRKRRLQLGALLGYPTTAIEAFANGKALHRLPAIAAKKKESKFINFRLSRHWQKEFEHAKKRAELIKQIAPELYRRIALQ